MNIAITGIRGIPARYGGFETCAEETSVRFARDHRVTVYCRRHNSRHDLPEFRGVKLVIKGSIPTKRLDTLSHTFFCVLDIIRRPEIEIVHLYNIANAVFIPILKAFGKRVAVSVDGLEWKRLKWGPLARIFYRISERLGVRVADAIIADSRVVGKYYQDKFGIEPAYIPYGARVETDADESLLKEFGLSPRGYFLFVGRLVPEKGVHSLIAAYNKTGRTIQLVIVGDDENHKEYIKSLKAMAGENVRFTGFVYGPKYQALNRYAFAYVSASQVEGTSPALVTAMAAGNCVLVNGIDENRETCGEAGIYFEENDIDDLARKMDTLAADPRLAEEYRIKALEHARANFDWDKVTRQYLGLFGSLMGIDPLRAESEAASPGNEMYEQVGR